MSQIKTIIFDFGDIFINLDKEGAFQNALNLFEFDEFPEELISVNILYEQGIISTQEFLECYQDNFPQLTKNQIIEAWNFIIKDFPEYRLEFIEQLAKEDNYKLIILSNTNALHLEKVIETMSIKRYNRFKNCFNKFYLSHEINLRKPNANIYEFVLKENNLKAEECLFIDDTKENTEAAKKLNINIWNLYEKTEDIVNLFKIKSNLF